MSLPSQIPKDYRENLSWRYEMLERCKADAGYRSAVKELFHRDIIFAFNAFFWTFDVRRRPKHHLPFCTYEFQDAFLLSLAGHIERGEDLLIEKSRDMGLSWMIILTYEWIWLNPEGGGDFLLGSRVEDYVDKKGDMRALIPKARYNLYRLPHWLQPKGFNRKVDDNFMRLLNPETGASITGESNNPNWSTGGRYLSVLCDEFAKWEGSDRSAWTAAGDASPCRIALSTPFGAAGQYYDLATDGRTKKLTLHWSLHPRKAEGLYCVWPRPEESKEDDTEEMVDSNNWPGLRSPWYDSEDKRRSPLEMAQELDIDYIGAGNPAFDGKAGKRVGKLLRMVREPVAFGVVKDGELTLELVPGPGTEEDVILIYELPDPAQSYVVACDVAEGKESGDYGVIKVLGRETEDVVATYHSKVDEIQLARVLVGICKYYTFEEQEEPWWAVETIGPGLATFDLATEIYDLPNAFMMPQYDTARQTISYRKGWWTSTSSRRVLVSGLKQWLVGQTGWCDQRCCREMTTFVRDKVGKPRAKEGCNDDEVMCLGIALQVNAVAPYEEARIEQPTRDTSNWTTGLPKSEMVKDEEAPPTLEERCMTSLLAKRELRDWTRADSDFGMGQVIN